MFLGMTGHVLKVDVTGMVTVADNTAAGRQPSSDGLGRRRRGLFVGDDAGKMRALDPTTFSRHPALALQRDRSD